MEIDSKPLTKKAYKEGMKTRICARVLCYQVKLLMRINQELFGIIRHVQ
jgi:hypothetical protein